MKRLVVLALLAACELEPAPKQQPAPAPGAAPAAEAKPPPPAPAPAPTPTPPENPKNVPIATGQDACTDIAVHYTEIGIAEAKDPQLKQQLEIDRARTVKRIADGCRDQKWSGDILDCYRAAKSQGDLNVCTKKLAAAQPPPAAHPPAPAPAAAPQKPAAKPAEKPAGKAPKAGKAK